MGKITATIGVVGTGSMGGAIARGVVASGALPAANVYGCDQQTDKTDPLAKLGCVVCADAADLAARQTDVVILAVKPQVLGAVMEGLSEALAGRLVVSIAAGVNLKTLQAAMPGSRVVRAMPNLPIQVLSGATALAPAATATPADVQLVQSVFAALGSAQVMREDQLDAEGAVVSCGPAYFALFVDALTRAGIRAGLPASACREMVEATMLGVAKSLLQTGEHPRQYVEKVTSPGGTTAAALYELEPLLVEGSYEAVDAALARTRELAGN